MVKLHLTESNVSASARQTHNLKKSGQFQAPATLSRTLDKPPEMVSMCMWRASHWFGATRPTLSDPSASLCDSINYRSMNPEELRRIPGPNKRNVSGGRGIQLAQRNEYVTMARRGRRSGGVTKAARYMKKRKRCPGLRCGAVRSVVNLSLLFPQGKYHGQV
jgi:hypothetical protein